MVMRIATWNINSVRLRMPLLKKFLETKTTLIDYEKIADNNGRRLVFFGKFAGNAGMVDTLYGLGQRLSQEFGIKTPFLQVRQSYQYKSVADAIEHLQEIGKEIEKNGLPAEIAPLNIFLLGYGHVSRGCQEILSALPIIEIDPDDLEKHQQDYSNNKIYLTIFKEKHLVERKDGSEFDLQHYFHNCAEYKSKFDKYLALKAFFL
jgi:alpha-aminoadipic semialdehyde synthase